MKTVSLVTDGQQRSTEHNDDSLFQDLHPVDVFGSVHSDSMKPDYLPESIGGS